MVLEAANGVPLGRVGPLGDWVKREAFPDNLVKAVLSIEDRRFYQHWGVDLRGIVRAARANWGAGGIVEGGSTITQQLAKMQFVGSERSLDRKAREALTAVWLDLRLSKDEILTQYLNSIYLGSGAHGVSAAARIYFDKKVSELTLPEAALLAGLIQAPSRYDPVRNLEAAQRRASVVVDAMRETGVIDAETAAKAKAEPATLKLSPETAWAASWFADWVAKYEFPKIIGSSKRVMHVRTTLRPELQQLAQRIINETLSRQGQSMGASQAALVALRPDGSVVAMVGGRDYGESQFNRAVDAKRQPGSAFKLFVYYAALRNGYSPDSIVDASPLQIGKWRPENYGGHEYGRMSLSDAFARSVNTAAIRLAMTVGLDKVEAAARELGLHAPLAKVPSMALGTNEVDLLDLTRAFASVRAGKANLEPWGILAFGPEGGGLRSLGGPNSSAEPLPQQQEITSLLQAVVQQGTGRAAALDNDTAAGKTGTSQDYKDAWFIGFNKELIVGVWVGNDDNTPMKGVTGGSLPAQIWKRFLTGAAPLLEKQEETLAGSSAEVEPRAKPTDTPGPQCDREKCSAKYRSFQSSDCTYQSFAGPRKLCEIGGLPEKRENRPGASTPGDDGEPPRTAASGEGTIPRSRRGQREPGEGQGAMSLGREDGSRGYMSFGSDLPTRPFGPDIFRRLDRRGGF